MALVRDITWQFAVSLWHVAPWLAGMGLVFSTLSLVTPCNAGKPWWRKEGLGTDIAYWIFVPIFTRYLRIWITVVGTIAIFHIATGQGIADFYEQGHGALGRLPLWVQGVIYLVATDFLLYWSHRMFHQGFLWKYHAVHHASKDVEWISAARFHPVNLILGTVAVDVAALLAGISPEIFIVLGPFNTMASVYVHANLSWTHGPLKYVLVSPVFHRWHHETGVLGRNFASTFSLWDVMFGTFHMPQGALPQHYGIEDQNMPQGLMPQLVYPLLQE